MKNHFNLQILTLCFLQDVLELGHQYWTPCKVNQFNFISEKASLIVTKWLQKIFLLKISIFDDSKISFIEIKI